MRQVEGALASYLHERVLQVSVLDELIADVRREAEALLSAPTADVAGLDSQLNDEHNQIRRLIKLAAQTGDEMGMIADEIQNRSARIKSLKATLKQATRQPEEVLALLDQIEVEARSDIKELRGALLADPAARHVYQALFPKGLIFEPFETDKGNRVWALSGRAQLGPLSRATPTGFECGSHNH